jgi:hypothetical protein
MKLLSANLLATLAMLLAGSDAFGQVQQAGYFGAHNQHGNCIGYQSCDWNNCQYGVNAANCYSGGHCRGGHSGRCSQCPGGLSAGSCWTNSCLNDTCLGRCCSTKAFPDSGWAPPARLPVNYDSTWYGNYHPQAYYGNPGGGFIANYPVVYQPTDTTQLGYYYHNVPTWQSRPGMIPPTPNPADYHTRSCPGHGFGNCHQNNYQAGNGQFNSAGAAPGTACHWAYQPHYTKNMMPRPRPAASESLAKKMFRSIEAVSFTHLID